MERANISETQYERAIAEHGIKQELHQQSAGAFRADLSTREVDGSVLYCDSFSQSYVTTLAPQANCVGFMSANSPLGPLRANGRTWADNEVVLSAPECGNDLVVPAETTADSVTLPESRFYELAAAVSPELEALDGTRLVRGNSSQLRQLRSHTREIVQNPLADPQHACLDNLLAEWVAWLGQTDAHSKRNSVSRARQAQIARQMRAYFLERYAQPTRMEDACRELGVGLRTLQRCFANYFQMTPYQYLKVLRFNKARRALLEGDPSTSSVTRIAMDSGFQHFGRFAVEYRQLFGEPPRQTLAANPSYLAA